MSDDVRRQMEMKAALKQLNSKRKSQTRGKGRSWRLDVSLPKLAFQGLIAFVVGVLVGLGAFVLFRIITA